VSVVEDYAKTENKVQNRKETFEAVHEKEGDDIFTRY